MKINYTSHQGKRTSLTLSDALVDTWLMCQDDALRHGSLAEATQALRTAIETTPPRPGQTFQATVEAMLLSDIRDHIHALEMQ